MVPVGYSGGLSEQGNALSSSTKGKEFLDQLSNDQLLKK
jgi:hypothetical protein